MADLIKSNNFLASALYQMLSKLDGNVFFSPLSIHAVLAMVFQGAQGKTAEVLEKTLKFPAAKITAESYKGLLDDLNSLDAVAVLMACKVFVKQHECLQKDFINTINAYFDSALEFLNFEQKQEAAKTINDWVEKQTEGKIKNILAEASINEDTGLVLVNTLYFKGDWKQKFPTRKTYQGQFYLGNKQTVDISMMNEKIKAGYKNNSVLQAQILQLPFQNDQIHILIILPEENTDIKTVEEQISTMDINVITENLTSSVVDVTLPKFKLEATLELEDLFKKLGLGNIFDEDLANFRGIIQLKPRENLFVDKIVQKNCFQVDEHGAEAASATVIKMKIIKKSAFRGPVFKFNRPAVFMLIRYIDGQPLVLFMGRLSKPEL